MEAQLPAYFSIIKYALSIIYPKNNSRVFVLYLLIKFLVEEKRRQRYGEENYHRIGLKPQRLPNKVHRKLIKRTLKSHIINVDHCILVPEDIFYDLYSEELFFRDDLSLWINMKVYVKQYDVTHMRKHKSYVSKIKEIIGSRINSPEDTQDSSPKVYNKIERVVQIVPCDVAHERNIAHIGETEYFNWIKSYGYRHCIKDDDVKIKFSPLKIQHAPVVADRVVVEMINAPVGIETDLQFLILNEYFGTPKFLHEKDHFEISLSENCMKNVYFKYLDVVRECGETLYFRCKTIYSKAKRNAPNMGYFIVKGVTEILQEQNVNAFLPFCKFHTLNLDNDDAVYKDMRQFYMESCPYGLERYFDALKKSFLPFLLEKEFSPLNTDVKLTIRPVFLIRGCAGSGCALIATLLAKNQGLNFINTSCKQLTSTTAKQTEAKIQALLQRAKNAAPSLVYLSEFEVFAVDSEGKEDLRIVDNLFENLEQLYENNLKNPIIILAACEDGTELKPNIRRLYLDEFEIDHLTTEQRYDLLKWILKSRNIIHTSLGAKVINNDEVEIHKEKNEEGLVNGGENNQLIQKIASKTEGFSYEDLDALVYLASRTSCLDEEVAKVSNNSIIINEKHFDEALENIRSMQNSKVSSLKIPNVKWEAVGGLDYLKKEVFRTIELPLKFPHLLANSGLKRSGILLWGPPGCGKTLIARAIASQLQANFLSVKGPELLDMYVGQSEKNMRDIFASARSAAPCVIFFDEAEAAAGARGASGDSGGAADRLVSQLLAELDGVASRQIDSKSSVVIVIAATNRPDLVEPALLRPGRLDKLLFVGPYVGVEDKVRVLKASSREFNLCDMVDLNAVADRLPDKSTGADLASVVNKARHHALRRTIQQAEIGIEDSITEKDIIISINDFHHALLDFVPSISESEMNYYESLKTKIS